MTVYKPVVEVCGLDKMAIHGEDQSVILCLWPLFGALAVSMEALLIPIPCYKRDSLLLLYNLKSTNTGFNNQDANINVIVGSMNGHFWVVYLFISEYNFQCHCLC